MHRKRLLAWLGPLIAAVFLLWILSRGALPDRLHGMDYSWLLAGREMLDDPGAAWNAPLLCFWRPVTKVFFAALYAQCGTSANPQVLIALIVHLLNGLLIADIALKFRSGAIAAALAALYFLLGSRYAPTFLGTAGLSISFPTFLALLGLRLGIARGTGAHLASILVLCAAMWSRESFLFVPLIVVLLLPDEERRWARLSPRFTLALFIITGVHLAARGWWHLALPAPAREHFAQLIEVSPGNLFANLWALVRVVTIPPRNVDPQGFWVAVLFFMIFLGTTTHLRINRHRILRLVFCAVLLFVPAAFLRIEPGGHGIAFGAPQQLYPSASLAAVALALVLTLRPSDVDETAEGYEDTCLRGLGELATVIILVGLVYSNSYAIQNTALRLRNGARAEATRLEPLGAQIRDEPHGPPIYVVQVPLKGGGSAFCAPPQVLRDYAELTLRGGSARLRPILHPTLAQLRRLDGLAQRALFACLPRRTVRLEILTWDQRARTFSGSLPQSGRWMVLAPPSPTDLDLEFELQGHRVHLHFGPRRIYNFDLSLVHTSVPLQASERLLVRPLFSAGRTPPSDMLFLFRMDTP